jgi:mRNA interferase MazF
MLGGVCHWWAAPTVARHPIYLRSHRIRSSAASSATIGAAQGYGGTDCVGQRIASENLLLDAGEANLPQRSVAIVSQVSTVEKSILRRRIGTLSQSRVEQLLAGLSFLQKTYFGR